MTTTTTTTIITIITIITVITIITINNNSNNQNGGFDTNFVAALSILAAKLVADSNVGKKSMSSTTTYKGKKVYKGKKCI